MTDHTSGAPFRDRFELSPLSGLSLKPQTISPVILEGVVRIFDVVIAIATGITAAVMYLDYDQHEIALYVTAITLTSLLFLSVSEVTGRYSTREFAAPLRHIPSLVLIWTVTFALLQSVIFFLKLGDLLSRVWLASWYLSGGFTLIVSRWLLAQRVKSWTKAGQLTRRAVVYGATSFTRDFLADLEGDDTTGIRIVGVFDDRSRDRTTGEATVRNGTLSDCVELARRNGIDLAIVGLPFSSEKRLLEVVNHLSVLPADIRLPAAATPVRLSPRLYSRIGNVAMIDLYDRPIADWGYVAKWVFDKVIASLLIVILAPLMAVIALLVKFDSRGPVIFRQRRYGFNNEMIEVFKFRSMYVDAEDRDASRLVTRGDPRVTRIGRFIRKTSIDELPQLFNVIRGELSLVGPRPHAVSAKAANQLYNEVVQRYFARHRVKPGITGWAQINGWRGETDTEDKLVRRVEHDLYYIDNWSVLFDLVILLRTPVALLRGENAY